MIDLMKFNSMVVSKDNKVVTTSLILLPLDELKYNLLINARNENLDINFNIDKYKFTHENIIFACKDFDTINLDKTLYTGSTTKTIKKLIEFDIVNNTEGIQFIIPYKYIKETNQIDVPENGRDLCITFDSIEYFNYCLGRIGNPKYFVVIKLNNRV